MADIKGFGLMGIESEENTAKRWGLHILESMKLTNARGLLIHARPKEMRIALYGALEALAEREALVHQMATDEAIELAKHFHGQLTDQDG